MPVLCHRTNGTDSTHILSVLTLAGVKRLLNASRSPLAHQVLQWVTDQIDDLLKQAQLKGTPIPPPLPPPANLQHLLEIAAGGSGMELTLTTPSGPLAAGPSTTVLHTTAPISSHSFPSPGMKNSSLGTPATSSASPSMMHTTLATATSNANGNNSILTSPLNNYSRVGSSTNNNSNNLSSNNQTRYLSSHNNHNNTSTPNAQQMQSATLAKLPISTLATIADTGNMATNNANNPASAASASSNLSMFPVWENTHRGYDYSSFGYTSSNSFSYPSAARVQTNPVNSSNNPATATASSYPYSTTASMHFYNNSGPTATSSHNTSAYGNQGSSANSSSANPTSYGNPLVAQTFPTYHPQFTSYPTHSQQQNYAATPAAAFYAQQPR